MSSVVVRFAPSPTGYLHIGGARTAIFNWLYARKKHGKFILRIEDTDAERSTADSVDGIINGLKWLGITWDEGPNFQSRFMPDHQAAAQGLLSRGLAYKCFCSKSELDAKRDAVRLQKQTYRYDGCCRRLTAAQIAAKEQSGLDWVLRFKIPRKSGALVFEDAVFGTIEKRYEDLEDFVIQRSDGRPLYILSNAVDDIRDGVTHIIRGQDGLANTPKQILIYQGLEAPLPVFAHMSLTLDPAKRKISKRVHGQQVAVDYYRQNGFLPWAMVNFLVLLGWSDHQGREVFDPQALIEAFDFDGMGRTNSVFNLAPADKKFFSDPKLMNMNAHYLRTMPVEDLLPHVRTELEKACLWDEAWTGAGREYFVSVVELLRPRLQRTMEFTTLGKAYFSDPFELEIQPEAPWLADLAASLETLETYDAAAIESTLRSFLKEYSIKTGEFITAVRTAVTGKGQGPNVVQILACLGRCRVVARMRAAANYPLTNTFR